MINAYFTVKLILMVITVLIAVFAFTLRIIAWYKYDNKPIKKKKKI